MSEAGFRVFNEAFPIGAEVLYAVCLVSFLHSFVTEHRRRRQRPAILFMTYLLLRMLCEWVSAPPGAFSLLLTAALIAEARILGLDRAAAFLLAVLYWNAKISSGLMLESLYFIAERIYPAQSLPPDALFLRAVMFVTAFLLSHAVLLAAMLYALQRLIRKRKLPLCRRELYCISLIPTAGILFGQIISQILVEFKGGMLFQLYEQHPAFLAAVPLLALLFYAGTYLAILSQQGMAALREEQSAFFMERQQTQAIRARIHEAEQLYAQVRQIKHEMRGHLSNIKGMAHNGEYASLEDYISKIDGSLNSFDLALQTGNPVTDVIINDKQRQCEDLGIRFHADFYFPEFGAYDAFDMGIILQNLLQNALEACESVPEAERFILLAGKRTGRFFLIEVRNSFAGKVAFGQDGLPATTKKEDAAMHGIGLSNVRREAEKYMGELELKVSSKEFSAAVLLQERSDL